MRIFYVYYHSYDYIPMHASDVIEEMAAQGVRLRVFTSVNPALLTHCPWQSKVPAVNMPVIKARFLERLSYLVQLALILPLMCLGDRPDLIYERLSMNTVLTVLIARALRIPLVIEVNGIVAHELALNNASRLRKAIAQWCECFSIRHSALTVTVNETIAAYLTDRYRKTAGTIQTVPNGTNLSRFAPQEQVLAREHFSMPAGKWPCIGYLGTLSPWCGVDLLIDSAQSILRQYPNAWFLIGGGEEPFYTRFVNRSRDRGVDQHFRFFGQIPWDKASLFIAGFDIAIVSLAPPPISGSPQKLYAYMACGKPVVGSDIGEIGLVLRTHEIGQTFYPGNASSLATAVLSVAKRLEQGEKLGQRARHAVVENYSWTVRVRQLLEYLAEVA